ncbi:unnamed protein product [Rotaria sp. Silwood2]|nr:unnamed protein product [Rotaria sp. Silwood2]
MSLLCIVCLLSIPIQILGNIKETIVENPFYLRARMHDSQTANVQFEIALNINQRSCQMYKFTIRHDDNFYSMPEQNLTFWRNSLELKYLSVGNYRICAIICSEYSKPYHSLYYIFKKENSLKPISACVNIYAYRSHYLILTLYLLVFLVLAFSQISFSLRKRRFEARMKDNLIKFENTSQKWHSISTLSISS